MRLLSQYINEKLSASATTLVQELLTCVFFDAYFNLNNKFKTTNDVVSYYENNKELIDKVASSVSIAVEKFDDFLMMKNTKGNYDKYSKDWQKSFLLQCEAFEKWVKTHPSFSKNLVFVHHDSSIGIHNGKIEGGWAITKRVDTGTSKYGFGDKDKYQKADIYAIVNDVKVVPEEDISNEVSYWIQSIEGKESETFVGISLKKLTRPLSSIHTYGLDQMTLAVDPNSITYSFPLFKGVSYKEGEFKAGLTTTELHCKVESDGAQREVVLAIRSNGKSAKDHARKDPKASYAVPTTTELKMKGSGAQGGKCQSLVSSWVIPISGDINVELYETKLKTINQVFNGIDSNIPKDAKELLKFLCDNKKTILDLYKKYEKGGLQSAQEEILQLGLEVKEETMDMLYDATKWATASFKIIQSWEAISLQASKSSIEDVIQGLIKSAKGIGDEEDLRLPYVLIGEGKDTRVNMLMGRFQPITMGHIKCAKQAWDELGVKTLLLVVDTTKEDEKHPFKTSILWDSYTKLSKEFNYIAGCALVQSADIVKNIEICRSKGFEPISWSCGTDRVDSYERMVNKYKDQIGLYKDFKVLEIKRTGEDISATKVRQAIKDNDKKTFEELTPKTIHRIYNILKNQIDKISSKS